MADIIDFRERRVAGMVAEISNIAADMRASEQAEAELLGLDYAALKEEAEADADADDFDPEADDFDPCDISPPPFTVEAALEERRDEIAETLGLRSACSLRHIAMLLRGECDMTAEEEQAIRYFRVLVLGEAV